MPILNLYVGSPYNRSETPERLFQALLIDAWEERDSDNYPEGIYYLGQAGVVEAKLWADEFEGFEEYPYRLALDLTDESEVNIDHAADLAIPELIKGGFTVARELSHGSGQVTRELYALDRSGRLVKTQDTRPAKEL